MDDRQSDRAFRAGTRGAQYADGPIIADGVRIGARRAIGESRTDLPVVLVLGGSRTGSTLLYQTLASSLPFSYLPNLSALLPDAPILATRLSERWFGRRKGDFVNFYGSVAGLERTE